MKEGWKYKTIGEIGTVIGGTTPSTTNQEYWGGSLCWISPAELDGSHYLYDSVKKITEKAVKAKSLKLLPVGTVLLSSRAPIGKVAVSKVETYCNQGFKCIVCGKELYNEYLYWWLWGKKDYLNSLGTGATFKEISKKVVENIVIPLPPLPEQQRIVEHLDSAFAKIDALKTNAEKMAEEAKALFASALREAMTPKEGWEEKSLKEIGQTQTGTTPSKSIKEYYGDYIPFIRPAELNVDGCGGIQYESEIKLSEQGIKKSRLIRAHSILMCCIGSVGKVGYSVNDVTCNQQINTLTPLENYDSKFVYYAMCDANFQAVVARIAQGAQATLPIINKGKWEQLTIFLPSSIKQQQSIVAHLDDLSAKVRLLEDNYKKICTECNALKQSILRETFE